MDEKSKGTVDVSIKVNGIALSRGSYGSSREKFRFSISDLHESAGSSATTGHYKAVRLVIENENLILFDQKILGENTSAAVRIAIWTIDKMLFMETNPECY